MHKELIKYYSDMQKELSKEPSQARKEQLFSYHCQRVIEFQHERLIHLIITLFFAILTIGAYILCLIVVNSDIPSITFMAVMLTLILTITEVCYISHYYKLENNTQKLYTITKMFNK